MRRFVVLSSLIIFNIAAVAVAVSSSAGQGSRRPDIGPNWDKRPYANGTLITPPSSKWRSARDTRIHSSVLVFVPKINPDSKPQTKGPPFSGYMFNTPASIACIYKQVRQSAGCDPNQVTENASGGSRVIAIIDPYDAPNISADLAKFSAQFDFPTAPNFEVVFASGTRPKYDWGWEIEASLDVEAAYAMAPSAKIILVEAVSEKPEDLLAAVDKANQLVSAAGGGEVSMSWIGVETATENSYDNHFMTEGIVYLGCSGDTYGALWPSVSSNVVAVGGTTILRDLGSFTGEIPWDMEGAGPSKYIRRPTYQNGVTGIVKNMRGVVDITAVGDPATGVWAYDSNFGGEFNGWFHAGGSSLATPIVAGIINRAGHFYRSTAEQLAIIYSHLGDPADFNDITNGTCGPNQMYSATLGWDFCTGVGSPSGTNGM